MSPRPRPSLGWSISSSPRSIGTTCRGSVVSSRDRIVVIHIHIGIVVLLGLYLLRWLVVFVSHSIDESIRIIWVACFIFALIFGA